MGCSPLTILRLRQKLFRNTIAGKVILQIDCRFQLQKIYSNCKKVDYSKLELKERFTDNVLSKRNVKYLNNDKKNTRIQE